MGRGRYSRAQKLTEIAEPGLPKWSDLSLTERNYKVSRSMQSVKYFITDKYMLNIPSAFPKQIELAEILTGERAVPGKKTIKELIVAVGMRSGKTTFGGMMACYAAFEVLNMVSLNAIFDHMLPGSPIRIANIAKSEKQSKETVFAQIKGQLCNSPYFLHMDPRASAMEVMFANSNIDVGIHAFNSSAASNVGRTLYFIVFDELAKFDDTRSKTSGWAVYEQLCKSTGTFPLQKRIDAGLKMAGNILVIGSILHVNDVIMQLVERAKQNPYMHQMVVPTWEFNPHLSFESLRPELEKSPESFWRDYGCVPYADVENLFRDPDVLTVNVKKPNILQDLKRGLAREIVTVDNQKQEIWYVPRDHFSKVFNRYKIRPRGPYILAGDPSAQRLDAFGLALGHWEDHKDGMIASIDGITRFAPQSETIMSKNMKIEELNPRQISGFILSLARNLPIEYAIFDTYHYTETIQGLTDIGILVENNRVSLDDYVRLKDAMKSFTIDICNYPFFLEECRGLVIKSAKRVDHPSKGSKDTSDAVANVLYGLTEFLIEERSPCDFFVAGGINSNIFNRGYDFNGESTTAKQKYRDKTGIWTK